MSMRRIAAELGAGPMSLYRHVFSKDDLLDLMIDVVPANAKLRARLIGIVAEIAQQPVRA